VELDRQAIERKDFPIARRGYDAVAVEAHLRTIAGEVEELQRAAVSGAEPSLATSAGTHVQSILAAAEQAAAEIERQASDSARQVREAADRDAESTRQDALDKARAHVVAVAEASAKLLERVGGMDTEVGALVDSLRAGAGRLAGDLTAVETNMAELYDAASGRAPAAQATAAPPAASAVDTAPAGAMPAPASPPTAAPAPAPAEAGAPQQTAPAAASGTDLDGARLIALNMALNGESRADTERYLSKNFQLADQATLIDEVYAAIEG
jgi:hypothetical protein